MKVVVGPFARSGLESRVGTNLPAAVNVALVYYVGKLNSGRRPPRFPDFGPLRGQSDPAGASVDSAERDREARPVVEVEVDERIEAALVAGAEREGVTPEELAGHAVLVYLAELDLLGEPEASRAQRPRALVGAARKANRSAH